MGCFFDFDKNNHIWRMLQILGWINGKIYIYVCVVIIK